MLSVLVPLICSLLLTPQQAQVEPFIPVGIWYAGPGALPPVTALGDTELIRSELALIRRAGYNSITTWVNWREAEPKRGTYALAAVERLIAAAAQNELKTDVRIFVDPAAEWSTDVAADRARFVGYVTSRLRLLPQIGTVEQGALDADLNASIQVGGRGGGKGRTPIQARLEFWAAMARGARRVTFLDGAGGVGSSVLSLGETIGIVTRNQALFVPLRPAKTGLRDIVGGTGAPVDVKVLESADALMIIGLNYAATPQKVTINFTPDMPEAIWQNLETSTSVHFVMGRGGPFLEYTFSPRDTLVLMIQKKLR